MQPLWSGLPALPSGEVQVFQLQVSGGAELMSRALQILSVEERARAAQIRMERAREEFIAGRALLRTLVGAATGCAPREVDLKTTRFGKPFVEGVHCNVTHSRGLIYVALCRDAPVGVDAEWIDPTLEVMELAEANFAADEVAMLAVQPAGLERARAFCRLWTRKEAVAKADGRGLRIPLHDIKVSQDETGWGWISSATDMEREKSEEEIYFVRELAAPYGFSCALAIKGGALPVTISLLLPH